MVDHKNCLKVKLDDLAAEMSTWEDDIRHLPRPISSQKVMCRSLRRDNCRDSFATSDRVPVSAHKARWEQLMTQTTPIRNKTNSTGNLTKLPVVRERQNSSETKNAMPIKNVVRSSISQPERERRERMAELAELRSRRMIGLAAGSTAEKENVPLSDSRCTPVDSSKTNTNVEEFSLPPPPSPEPMKQQSEQTVAETPSVDAMDFQPQPDTTESITPLCDVCPELLNFKSTLELDDVVDGTLSDTQPSDDKVHPEMVSHAYFSRPKFGGKRAVAAAEECCNTPATNDNTTTTTGVFIRQRSVTFEAPPGTAPGDSASECGLDSEADSVSCKSTDGGQPPSLSSEENSPQSATISIETEDCDSDMSAYLDTALEAAAADGSTDEQTTGASEVADQTCSDSEAVISSISSRTSSSFKRNSSGSFRRQSSQVSIGGAKRKSFGRQSDGCDISEALLDANTTITNTTMLANQNKLSPTKILDARRRNARLKELPDLIKHQRRMINKAGAAMHQCTTAQQPNKKSSYFTPKRSRSNNNALTGSMGAVYVDACRVLLIACQQHQVLMEELAVLHRGSSVLVPPTRGDPIRARLKLRAVRLYLKQFLKPGDPTSGGGYVVIPAAKDAKTMIDSTITQYHLLAILKCRGEGRLFQTEMVTVVRASDLPVSSRRIAKHIELRANFEILPLRPDFLINLEVYCLRIGSDANEWPSFNSPQLCSNSTTTPTTTSVRTHTKNPLSACLPTAYLLSSPFTPSGKSSSSAVSAQNKLGAFTLLSSVDIRYHDDMLSSRPRTEENVLNRDGTSSVRQILPLSLLRLPKSTPLTGNVGLIDAAVQLEARILTRGFLTVFEEVGGLGLWRRYWCQLRADHLQFWRDPEDEERALQDDGSYANKPSPLGRIDFRQIAAPRAVPAPRRICARENALYMRSLLAIEPGWLSASVSAAGSVAASRSSLVTSDESILFHASSDYTWLEQKHLMCADTAQERDNWVMWFNFCLDALKNWMPAHFYSLAQYDARLQFSHPVSAKLAALILHG